MTARRFPFWATILTLAGVAVLCGLGTWQVKRLAWKEGLLARLDALYAAAPQDSDGPALRSLAPLPGTPFVARVTVDGTYEPAQSVAVGPRVRDGQTGYHLITPLRLADGSFVLVNRGWVADRPAADGAGQAHVTGLLRIPETPNRFVPPNDPAQDTWFSIAPDQIAQAHHLAGQMLPYILYAESAVPADPAAQPAGGRPELPNNHRSYAVFWYSMALALIAVYGLRFCRRTD